MSSDVYTKLKDYFEKVQLPYREIAHAPGASAEEYHNALGCRYEQQAKCLLIKVYAEGKEYFAVFTVPAQKRADLEVVRSLLNAKKVRMASRDELKEVTGCNFGELPPVGSVFTLKLLMDKDFLREQEIFMNAGRVDISFVINPVELQRIENPLMV